MSGLDGHCHGALSSTWTQDLALIALKVDNGLVVHIDALAGSGPRAAVTTALGLR